MKALLTISLCSLHVFFYAQYTVFQQDFNTSNTVSDYVAASPTNAQFNAIGGTGAGMTVSIESGKLKLSKTGSNSGSFTRNTDFSNIPTAIIFSFKVAVSDNTAATTSAAILYVGDGLSTNFSIPSSSDVYARLAFTISSTANSFNLRDISSNTNSAVLNGETTITWVLNNSGSALTYTAPTGSSTTVGNDQADVWANTSLVFNDLNVLTTTQTIANIKFLFNDGNGSFTFDDLHIIDAIVALPIEIRTFKAKTSGADIRLYWQTALETQGKSFDIEHSNTGQDFQKIGHIEIADKEKAQYEFYHPTPSVGTNYYRLKQENRDGRIEYSRILSIPFGEKPISISPNPAYDYLSVQTASDMPQTFQIFDLAGKIVQKDWVSEEPINISHLQSGIYFIKIADEKVFRWVKY